MKFHKFADLFPMMDKESFKELKRDIMEKGLIEPIVTYDEQILDGRNRYVACTEAGIEPKIVSYNGKLDPLQYVISTNLKRRHLTESQRAAIALESKPLFEEQAKERMSIGGKGVEQFPPLETGKARDQLGKVFTVSGRYISDAERIKEKKPEEFKQIREGKKTISEVKIQIKKEERQEKIEKQKKAIEEGTIQLPEGKFEIIVLDPPWDYGCGEYSPDHYMGRVASPYPTMSVEEIKKIELPATDDCVLFLWTTHKFMRYSFEILDSWGFQDKAILTWVKNKIGIGRWLRSKSEFCIMAVKGRPSINLTNQTTVLIADNKQHSRKPDEFYKMVEELCIGRKLDYFARKKRSGWEVFGDEVDNATE